MERSVLTLGNPLPPDSRELARLLTQVSASGVWSNGGPLSRELESRVASRLGWRHAAATSSGTSALTAALQALRLPPGSEVITTPFTFRATALAIEAAGLIPVFATVDPDTLLLDSEAVANAVTDRVSAVLPVHLFGVAVDRRVDEVAHRAGIPVVYDAAHTFELDPGVLQRGVATAYSMHATKLLHTGEGGLVATDHDDVWREVLTTRNFGLSSDGEAGAVAGAGANAKLSEPAAAVGLAMWDLLDEEMGTRRRIRDAYTSAMAQGTRFTAHASGRPRALVMEAVRCASDEQEGLLAELAEVGVVARVFPMLTERGQRYEGQRIVGGTQESLTRLAKSVIALPIHGRITPAQLDAVCTVLAR